MIDIRQVAKAIGEIKINDPAAKQAAIHQHLRNYGVELLGNLSQAIVPTNESEAAAIMWLKDEIKKLISQIPQPVPTKQEKAS